MDTSETSSWAFELAQISANTMRGISPYSGLLGAATRLFDGQAAMITRSDPTSGRLSLLDARGYEESMVRLCTSRRMLATDPAIASIGRQPQRPPIRWWSDPDYRYEDGLTARNYLRPAGFNGGVSARIFDTDGSHVGDVHVSTHEKMTPSGEQLDQLTRALPILSVLLGAGPVRTNGEVSTIENGRVLSCAADANRDDIARIASMIPRAARVITSGSVVPVHRFRWKSSSGSSYRVDLSRARAALTATVYLEDIPYGLTAKELEVLGCLCSGSTNTEIAARLFLSERTVAHSIERILRRLNALTRTAAVSVAIAEGLHGPTS